MTRWGPWREVGLREKGLCGRSAWWLAFMSGRHSGLFTHMIFWAFLPLFLSIIHDHFSRVIPLTTFPRKWPLANPLPTLLWGHRRQGLMPKRVRCRVPAAGCPCTSRSGPSLSPACSVNGNSCIDSSSIQSAGHVLLG